MRRFALQDAWNRPTAGLAVTVLVAGLLTVAVGRDRGAASPDVAIAPVAPIETSSDGQADQTEAPSSDDPFSGPTPSSSASAEAATGTATSPSAAATPTDSATGSAATSPTPSRSPTTSPSNAATPSPTAAPSPAPGPSQAPAPSATPAPSPPASPPPSSGGTGFSALPAGTFSYDTDGDTQINSGAPSRLPATTTLTATAVDGEGRQRLTRDLRDDSGTGTITTTTVVVESQRVLLERIELEATYGGITQRNDFLAQGTVVLAERSAQAGAIFGGTFTADGTTAEVEVEVLAREGDTVTVTITVDFEGDLQGQQTSTATLRASDLLTLSEQVDSEVTSGPFTIITSYRATLK